MTPALAVDVAARIGDFDLDVAFEVQTGVAVLFGPSGAGKSLTMAMIAGLVRPQRGTISITGRTVDDTVRGVHVSTQARRVGMVFQDGLLLPHRNVLDNVALAVRTASKRAERRDVATGWLERVGAADLAARRPLSLSGGQRQRVALARALAGDPALLLLDEPLSALDLTVRLELRSFLRDVITATGIPSVLVTHDADEADAIGDLIIQFGPGTVIGTRPVLRSTPPLLGTIDEAGR